MEEWWCVVVEEGAEGVGSEDVGAGCRRSRLARCGVRWCACGGVWMPAGLIGVWWCVMCVEQEEACESLELLQVLPAVMLELMKLMDW